MTDEPKDPSARVKRGLAAVWWWPTLAAGLSVLLAAIILVTTAGFIYESYAEGPLGDYWYFISAFELLERGGSYWRSWFALYNVHWIAVPNTFHLIEVTLFSGKNIFEITANCVLQLLVPAMLIATLLLEPRRPPWQPVVFLAGVSISLAFSGTQLENLVVPWQVAYVMASTGTCVAFFCLTRLRQGGAETKHPTIWLVLCVLGALLGTFSMAAGLLSWPTLVAMCLLLQVRPRVTGLVAAIGISIFATYGILILATYFSGEARDSVDSTLSLGLETVRWLTACLGSPLTSQHAGAGIALGGAGIILGARALIRVVTRRSVVGGAEVFSAGLLAFSGGSVVLMALGRTSKFPEMWSAPRYQGYTLFFWLALVTLLTLQTRAGKSRLQSAWRGGLWLLTLVWISFSILPAHFQHARTVVRAAERFRSANVAILMGLENIGGYHAVLPYQYPHSPDPVQKTAPFLRERGIGVYAERHHELLGKTVLESFTVVPDDRCSGNILKTRPFHGVTNLFGRARDLSTHSPPRLLVFSDLQGRITGLGKPVERRVRFLHSEPTPEPGELWWGYLLKPAGEGEINAWAILRDRQACRFAQRASAPAD